MTTFFVGLIWMFYDVTSTRMLNARIESTSDTIERYSDGFRACHVSSAPIVSLNRKPGTTCEDDTNVAILVFETSTGCSMDMKYDISFYTNKISCNVVTKSQGLNMCTFDIPDRPQVINFEIHAKSNEDVTIFKHRDTIRLPSPTQNNIDEKKQLRSSLNNQVFKVGIVGDSQAETTRFRQQLQSLRMHNIDMFVHLGDVVQDDSSMFEWYLNFFRPISSKLGSYTPILYSRGNHDVESYLKRHSKFSEHPVSTISPNGYYAYNAAGIRFLVLDTASTYNSKQTEWLKCEVSSRAWLDAKFRVVLTHIPPFVEYWDPRSWRAGENRWGYFNREIFVPILEAAGMDIMFSGHSHVYQRGKRGSSAYVVAGGGGATLERVGVNSARVENWNNMYDVTYFGHHYSILSVVHQTSGISRLVVQTYNIENVVVDLFVVDEN